MLFLNSIFVEFLKDPQPAADVRHVEGKLKLTMVERLVDEMRSPPLSTHRNFIIHRSISLPYVVKHMVVL